MHYHGCEKMRPITLRESPSSVTFKFNTTFNASSTLGSQSPHAPLHQESKPTTCSTPCSRASCTHFVTPRPPPWILHHEVVWLSTSYSFQPLVWLILHCGYFPVPGNCLRPPTFTVPKIEPTASKAAKNQILNFALNSKLFQAAPSTIPAFCG